MFHGYSYQSLGFVLLKLFLVDDRQTYCQFNFHKIFIYSLESCIDEKV